MRLIILEVCVSIFVLLFLTTLTATVWHRVRHGAGGAHPGSAMAEYLWAVVPWLMVAGGAFPAVRLTVAAA